MTNIYNQHEKAFASVSAYVILEKGQRIGTVAFKFPKDGAGRLYCYFHVFGLEMVRGHVNGFGYDKRNAAFLAARDKIKISDGANPEHVNTLKRINAIRYQDIESRGFLDSLREAGFEVFQAV